MTIYKKAIFALDFVGTIAFMGIVGWIVFNL